MGKSLNMTSKEKLKERYNSFKELLTNYRYILDRTELLFGITERYKGSSYADLAIDALITLTESEEEFNKLYKKTASWKYKIFKNASESRQ